MQKTHDLFFALVGRKVRGRILAYLLVQHPKARYIAEIAGAVRTHPSSAQRELRQLERLGLVDSSSGSYRKYYRLRVSSPVVELLRRIWTHSR